MRLRCIKIKSIAVGGTPCVDPTVSSLFLDRDSLEVSGLSVLPSSLKSKNSRISILPTGREDDIFIHQLAVR